jgi:V/A-type H+-transporting ATPase subunit F
MKFERVAVVGARELVLGFKLIGIHDVFIRHGVEAVKTLMDLINAKSHNLIMASEEIKSHMDSSSLRIAETSLSPLVVFIPLPGIEEEKESVEKLAKRVLGVDIKGLKK